MITIGVDTHKRVHAAVAIDAQGQELASWRGSNRAKPWAAPHAWAREVGEDRIWGIEGAGQYGHGLAQALVTAGETVLEVNPRLTAETRRQGRSRSKTDRIDALAVARAVQREDTPLPVVAGDDLAQVLATLAAERAGLQGDATSLRNRMHQVLHLLDPERAWPSLTSARGLTTLLAQTIATPTRLQQTLLATMRRQAIRLRDLLDQIAAVGAEIEAYAAEVGQPLIALPGVGTLTAGQLIAELGCGQRFATDSEVAMYAGTAPLEVSSASVTRHRLNRTGNRRLNSLIYRIAWGQERCHPPAQAYLAKKHAEGKSRKEARRCLMRYITRAVFRKWQACTLAMPDPLT